MLFFVNLPIVIGIPIINELGLLGVGVNAKKIGLLLHMADFFLCFNSVIIYLTVKRLVQSI